MLSLWSLRVIPAFFNSLEVPERSCDCTASEADRPLTLKNQMSPGFSRVLAPSDSDSAVSALNLFCFVPQVSVYSGSEPSGISWVEMERKFGLFLE